MTAYVEYKINYFTTYLTYLMTELDLYKFIKNNKIERHEYEWDIIWFISFWLLEEFCSMVWYSTFDEWWYEVRLKDDCIALSFNDMCDYHWIEIKNVFKSE